MARHGGPVEDLVPPGVAEALRAQFGAGPES